MTFRVKLRLLVVALALVIVGPPVLSNPWQDDGSKFRELLRAAERNRWGDAEKVASEISLPVALTIKEWLRLRAGVDDFGDYQQFLKEHSDWPGLKILRKSGEATLTSNTAPTSVVAYFVKQAPQTGHGAIQLAQAFQRLQLGSDAKNTIIDGWKSLPFTLDEHRQALELYDDILAPFHLTRLNNLLWQKRYEEAEWLFPLVNTTQKRLAEARIALQKRANGVDSRIRRIPEKFRDDSGLSFDRVRWRFNNDDTAGGLALFIEASLAKDNLTHPENWAPRRISLAHGLMRKGQFKEAYLLASHHHLFTSDGKLPTLSHVSQAHREKAERQRKKDCAELEWLSGYLSLRFLNDSTAAIRHFSTFETLVDTPISIGRAGYWLGQAFETAGFSDRALNAFAKGAKEQTTFYGQLAAEHLRATSDRNLAGWRAHSSEDKLRMQQIPVVQAGLLYRYAGNQSHSAWFLSHVAENLNEADSEALAALAFDHQALFSVVKVAKEGVKNGYNDISHLFPLVGMSDEELPIPTEVALAIARQETEFRESAVSSKGAVGFMQIKPSTGQELANDIGLTGPIKSLLRNRQFNVLLGSTYLRDRLEEFDGSYIMAIAAYNAGPRRVRDWLQEIGDPRRSYTDPIDWIEHIPYGETRNYVMRVLEAITVYRMRLTGQSRPIRLSEDLIRGQEVS